MALAKYGQFQLSRLVERLNATAGMKFVMGSGATTTWTDELGTDDMDISGGASHSGDYITFDGTDDYAVTPGVSAPTWASGFAGSVVDGASFNGSGITLFLLFRTTDIASRVIAQWENSGDNCKWYTRVNSSGYIEFWNCYWNDGVVNPAEYLTDPFSKPDRANRLTVDIRPYVNDNQWHLLQFSRATAANGYYEKKALYIDGVNVFYGGTGNVVNGFTDWDVPISFGKAAATGITGDPAFSNFQGDVALFACRNRWTTTSEMSSIASYAGDNNFRRGRVYGVR